ncbi:MAG: hypothetical protein NTY45_15205 [Elusimicrobia bacterium]|nr:hypothetical protein [Elusimicrobiota bacterium]
MTLRDAVADPGNSCPDRQSRLAKLNSELVDAKAWYWALRMKTPGFSAQNLERNPGSEIADPGLKARFYKLLAFFYETGTAMPPDQERLSAVIALIKMERKVADECGLS